MEAGARLFARRGYHAVGINDISAELGVSGPAFYRHFPSKESLLVALLDDAITGHLEEVQDLAVRSESGLPRLEAIVAHHIEFVFDSSDAIMSWRREARFIPDADRQRIGYLQKLYVQEWVRALQEVVPHLSTDEALLRCSGSIALIQSSIRFGAPLPRPELTVLLQSMAMTTLLGKAALPAAASGRRRG